MGMWEFLRKCKFQRENEETLKQGPKEVPTSFIKENPQLEGTMDQNAKKLDDVKDLDPLNITTQVPSDDAKRAELGAVSFSFPAPELLDSRRSESVDVSKLILSSTVPDHQIASIVLSNIFLIPRNYKGYDDSWPVYQRNLDTAKEARVGLLERKFKEDISSIKGKRKKLKGKYSERLREQRTLTQRYFEDFQKIVSIYIQKIRIDIIPMEKEITESKYKLNENKQKIYDVKRQQVEKMNKYNNLLQSNVKVLTSIRNGLKNALSIKKIWHATHIVASYVVAFMAATQIVKTENFRNFIYDKLSKLSSISDFLLNNFTIVQGISAGLIFLISIGMYDKFVIDYLNRRQVKRELDELAKQDRELNEQLETLIKRISYVKEKKTERIKDLIREAEENILYFFDDYDSNMKRLEKKRFEEPN